MQLRNIIIAKECRHQTVLTLWFRLYKILEQVQLIQSEKKKKIGGTRDRMWERLTGAGYGWTFRVMEMSYIFIRWW